MPHTVSVRHNFETAHRLPHLSGKCENLHGHSWWVEVTVTAAQLAAGTVVEFGAYKRELRRWIDQNLDHGTMLGPGDPLLPLLRAEGCKVYAVQDWPTVENVAGLLADVARLILDDLVRAPGAYVSRVHLAETHVNAATWEADPAGTPV